jgi:lipooligosaccharide transport system permease protein
MELALRAYESWLAQYKRVWRGTLTTSVVNPVLYLAALGIGLGSLVNRNGNVPGGGSYLHFVAPGMLAAAVMQVAAQESSWPVMGAIKWTRTYLAQLASPLGVRDILLGHQLFIAMRSFLTGGVYLAVIAAFGAVRSPYGVLVWPSALLVGTAFSAPIAAYAARMNSDGAFNPLFRFGIVPMFLFSGTFFPVARLPLPLEWLAYATPLWHGVALCRDLTLGRGSPLADLGHAGYLALWTAAGLWLAERSYRRRLVK